MFRTQQMRPRPGDMTELYALVVVDESGREMFCQTPMGTPVVYGVDLHRSGSEWARLLNHIAAHYVESGTVTWNRWTRREVLETMS